MLSKYFAGILTYGQDLEHEQNEGEKYFMCQVSVHTILACHDEGIKMKKNAVNTNCQNFLQNPENLVTGSIFS